MSTGFGQPPPPSLGSRGSHLHVHSSSAAAWRSRSSRRTAGRVGAGKRCSSTLTIHFWHRCCARMILSLQKCFLGFVIARRAPLLHRVLPTGSPCSLVQPGCRVGGGQPVLVHIAPVALTRCPAFPAARAGSGRVADPSGVSHPLGCRCRMLASPLLS